jgi:uncharacterized protein YoxC
MSARSEGYVVEALESMRQALREDRMMMETMEAELEAAKRENEELRDRLESLTAQIERMSNA